MANKRKTTKKPATKQTAAPIKNEKSKPQLDSKTQLQIILFSLLTFGVFYIILNMKIKENEKALETQADHTQTLTTTNEIPFEITTFLQLLGGVDNIIGAEATLNTLKVEVNDPSKVDVESIKKLGAKGILKNTNKFSIIFGDYATHLQQLMTMPQTDSATPLEEPLKSPLENIPSFYEFLEKHCEKPMISVAIPVSKTI